MDCGCVNTGISIYFQCRILAAKNNVYLKSRESAAEYFGISVSSLANYERGITVPPLDLIMMMADVYGAPQLKNLYCLEQCPLGKQQPVSAEIKTLEAVTVGIIAKLDEKDIEKMRRELLEIAEDGKISPDEEDDFTAVSKELDKAVCDREKAMLKPLQEAERILKGSIAAYQKEQERKKRELEERMRLEAEAERDKKLSEAAAAEEAGNLAEAEMALAEAQMVETVAASTTVVMNTPKTKGIGTAKDWEIESIDREKVPVVFSGVEIRPVDEKAIMRLIRATKGSIQIPGIKYKETVKVSIRR